MLRRILLAGLLIPAPAMAGKATKRPEAPTYGLGVGINAPAASLAPNAASVRARLTDSFTLEPIITYGQVATEPDDGDTTTMSTINFGSNARINFATKGKVDGQIVGGLGYYSFKQSVDTDSEPFTQTSGIYFDAGLGVESWLNPHWSASMDALLLGYMSSNNTAGNDDDDTTDTTSLFGINTAPGIRLMLHCYL